MNSKNWKSLLVVSALAVLATACGRSDDKAQEPSSQFTGIWASSDSVKLYDTYGSNESVFCKRLSRYLEISPNGKKGTVKLYSRGHMVQPSGEVFTYQASASVADVGYREENYQGYVAADGLFQRKNANGTEIGFGGGDDFRAYSPIQDKSRMYLSADGMELKVFQGGKHLYFSRTTDLKIASFESAKALCIEKWKRHGVPSKGEIADATDDQEWAHEDIPDEDTIDLK